MARANKIAAKFSLVLCTLAFMAIEMPLPALTADLEAGAPISTDYARALAGKVNEKVSKEFFDAAMAEGPWHNAFEKLDQSLTSDKTAPRTLTALGRSINEALASLKTSHCQFASTNDESFFFLHSLFGTINRRFRTGPNSWAHPIACTGLVTGGCGFDENQIRYVLDGSPAARAGLLIGDHLLEVNGRRYSGYLDFFSNPGKEHRIKIDRPGAGQKEIVLTTVRKELYPLYVEATQASKKIIKQGKYSIGYVHLWSGGTPSAEAVKEILTTDFKDVDGLVYDLRDGYGGASMEDLDVFYRPRAAFPDCSSKDRAGKIFNDRMYFDKPVVVLINSGSRSGKELLAYSFKSSGRALLVGENTAGAVVAGRLFPLDGKCALYLAVADISLAAGQLGGKQPNGKQPDSAQADNKQPGSNQKIRLEGLGVAPDIVILNKTHDQIGYGLQLSSAIEALEKRLAGQN